MAPPTPIETFTVITGANEPLQCTGGKPVVQDGADGFILPLFTMSELAPVQWGPAIVYLIGLLWCFMGVGIISDIFMCAIEKITSAKRTVKVMIGGKEQIRTQKIWNDTVANLTLMALGSSAPEILLSLLELLVTEKMHSGALGPSTIVGSAAFNLLIITAVCISALPAGEERKIKDLSVFAITATFSIFAYLWLIIILMLITPDVVDVWEGIVTLLFLPLLVGLAYLADIGWFHKIGGGTKLNKRLVFSPSETSKEDYDAMIGILKQKYPKVPDDPAKLEALLYYEFPKTTSRAARRVEANRNMTGQAKQRRDDHYVLGEDLSKGLNPTGSKGRPGTVHPVDADDESISHVPKAVLEHGSPMYAVSEAAKKVTLTVVRSGNTEESASCRYRTMEGTAKAEEDFRKAEGKLDFNPGVTEMSFEIEILEDKKHESTEEFYVELMPVPNQGILGFVKIATVVVLDSDSPGELRFEKDALSIPEPSSEKSAVQIKVQRVKGATGDVKCSYRTEDASAKAGKDYEEVSGELCFASGEIEKKIPVEILPVQTVDKRQETFRLILEPCEEGGGGVGFDDTTDGGADSSILTICIESDADGQARYNMCIATAAQRDLVNWDNVALGREHWWEQFVEAMYVNGSKEEQAEAGPIDWFFHIVSLPWKLFFAIVPPVDFCGGWVCFVCALVMIAVCTALIGDLANLLGCALDVKPPICAITFVALGTSLPDTFASKTAAIQDPIADNSVGNVTGSNSVNVFLGLGLSWAIGAIYWAATGATKEWLERAIEMGWVADVPDVMKDYGGKVVMSTLNGVTTVNILEKGNGAFVVPAGSLGASVGVFCGCAVSCIGLLMARRIFVGAELGGNVMIARVSSAFLIMLWFVYIGMSVVFEKGFTNS